MIGALVLLVAACSGGAPERRAPAPPEPDLPNVLVVVWDTVRADHTSLYGYDKDTTPRTRAWAAEHGVVYERAVSPGVYTLPSHASLFTGLPVRAHGVNADHTKLDAAVPTFAEALGEAGFETWAFVANPYLAKGSGLLEGFAKIEAPWNEPWKARVEDHLKSKLVPEDASTTLSPSWPGKAKRNKYLFKDAGPVAAEALDGWLAARPDAERPFLAFVNLMEAHIPRLPSLAARQAVMTPDEIERSWRVVQDTDDFHEWMTGLRTYDPLDLAAIRGVYDASLLEVDAATEAILRVLDARGLSDDTIVVVVSDHGESLGDHGLLLHKYGVWNALSRVPLVIAWPGHLPPGRVSEPFPVEDTLLRVAELGKLPLGPKLSAQLAARPKLPDGAAITEYDAVAEALLDRVGEKAGRALDRGRLDRTWAALEQGPWKVVVDSTGAVQLFDVAKDPGETDDRAAAVAAEAERLKATLSSWQAGVKPAQAGRGGQGGAELREGLEALGYVR